jgi:GMP synthase-like glutamine amidotransferase
MRGVPVTRTVWVVDNTETGHGPCLHKLLERLAGVARCCVVRRWVPECDSLQLDAAVLSGSNRSPMGIPESVREPNTRVLALGLPTLAVCFGAQLVNCELGGTLVRHDRRGRTRARACSTWTPPPRSLADRVLQRLTRLTMVWEAHDYGFGELGRGLRPLAVSVTDGRVLAYSDASGRLVGTLFHPEALNTTAELVRCLLPIMRRNGSSGDAAAATGASCQSQDMLRSYAPLLPRPLADQLTIALRSHSQPLQLPRNLEELPVVTENRTRAAWESHCRYIDRHNGEKCNASGRKTG